jgi:hypothetical protein
LTTSAARSRASAPAAQTCDGCHPVDAGYTIIGQTMYNFLMNKTAAA